MKKSTVSFKIINWIKMKSIGWVLLILVSFYLLINSVFGIIYYAIAKNNYFIQNDTTNEMIMEQKASESESDQDFFDYIYFSFITAATIGYGDYYPTESHGKILVIIQSVFCSVYVAIMMSIITSKIFWPEKSTVVFSKKILYCQEKNNFQVRMINTNSMPIINPEIRITMTEHGVGDFIAGVLELDNNKVIPSYLGRHDFILNLGVGSVDLSNMKKVSETDIIFSELNKAIEYQNVEKKNDSRFRITITLSGSNGLQNIAEIKKYYASDFVRGKAFEAIKYEDNDTDILGVKYKRISNFWTQFEKIENETSML